MFSNKLDAGIEICEIGRRLYSRGFAAANDGNISCRISQDRVLCTPTLICKGFMTPRDLCVVDLDGNQIAGRRKRTSEILLHLEIYRSNDAAKSVVHCHPPHATAFAVAGQEIPTGILPEVEVFLGSIPTLDFEIPGTAAFAQKVRPYARNSNSAVLSNHGTVSWGDSVEQAFWLTEILDAYCRILMLASAIGGVRRLPAANVRKLLDLRPLFGMPADGRQSESELFRNPKFARSKNGPRTGPSVNSSTQKKRSRDRRISKAKKSK